MILNSKLKLKESSNFFMNYISIFEFEIDKFRVRKLENSDLSETPLKVDSRGNVDSTHLYLGNGISTSPLLIISFANLSDMILSDG